MTTMLRAVTACVLLAAGSLLVPAQADQPPEWTPAEKRLADKATKLNDEGEQLFGLGKRKEAAACTTRPRRPGYGTESRTRPPGWRPWPVQ